MCAPFSLRQMNDGPLCKCSAKARRTGIRHSIYPGEEVTGLVLHAAVGAPEAAAGPR